MSKRTKCKTCPWWVLTTTLKSPDEPIWHCKDGLTPTNTCEHLCEHNEAIKEGNNRGAAVATLKWFGEEPTPEKIEEIIDRMTR